MVIEIAGHSGWNSAIAEREANNKIVSSRPYGKRGMLHFVMINSNESLRKTLRAIKSRPDAPVRNAYVKSFSLGSVS